MMKRIISCMVICLFAITSRAQFEQNKWVVAPSLNQINISYSSKEKTNVGFEAEGGLFVADNFAVLLNGGADIKEGGDDRTTLGVGARYYFSNLGIYVGSKVKLDVYNFSASTKKDATVGGEVGYAFFLNRNLTVEPAIYYNQSLTDQHYSKLGIKLGFGYYF